MIFCFENHEYGNAMRRIVLQRSDHSIRFDLTAGSVIVTDYGVNCLDPISGNRRFTQISLVVSLWAEPFRRRNRQ